MRAKLGLFLAPILASAALLPPLSHAAKPVFRCQVGLRVVYADEPCVGTTGRTVAVDDSRTPVQRKAALEATRRNADFAREARAERLASERAAATQMPAGIRMAARGDDDVAKPKRKRGPVKKVRKVKVPPMTEAPTRRP